MDNTMAMNTYLSTTESKKQNKQEELRQNHGLREHFDGCQMGGRGGGKDEEVRRLRSTNWQVQNSHRDVKYSIGNGVDKKPTYDPWT